MKVRYWKVENENRYIMEKCVYKFKIEKSILKSHYKILARMSMLFNVEERGAGFIRKNDEQKFLNLIEKINKSNDKRCATSHKKAIEKRSAMKARKHCNHDDLGSLGYRHGERVRCPHCGAMCTVW